MYWREEGKYGLWLNSDEKSEYNERAKCLIDQYDQLVDENTGLNLNGKKTLDENIADNAGLKVAFMAHEKYLEKNVPLADRPIKRREFFFAYANVSLLCQKRFLFKKF